MNLITDILRQMDLVYNQSQFPAERYVEHREATKQMLERLAPAPIPPAPVDLGEVDLLLSKYANELMSDKANFLVRKDAREALMSAITRFAVGKDGERWRRAERVVAEAADMFSPSTNSGNLAPSRDFAIRLARKGCGETTVYGNTILVALENAATKLEQWDAAISTNGEAA